jgi:hypothetical protein
MLVNSRAMWPLPWPCSRRANRYRPRTKLLLLRACALLGVLILALTLRKSYAAFSLVTLIRGDEWSGENTEYKSAVLNGLLSFSFEVGASRLILMVDTEAACLTRPFFLRNALCVSIQDCAYQGTPTMDCVLGTALKVTKSEILGFVNGDIMVFQGLVESVKHVDSRYGNFLLVGRRHMGNGVLLFEENHVRESFMQVKEQVRHLPLDSGYAIDYFIARRNDWSKLLSGFPPFLAGAWRWDNALLSHAYRDKSIKVVDGTKTVIALHQITPVDKKHETRRGAQYNNELAHSYSGEDFWFGSIAFADILLTEGTQGIIGEPQGKFQALLRKAFDAGLLSTLDDISDFRDLFEAFATDFALSEVKTVSDVATGERDGFISFLRHFERDRLSTHLSASSRTLSSK